jgi:hypothetical protein
MTGAGSKPTTVVVVQSIGRKLFWSGSAQRLHVPPF